MIPELICFVFNRLNLNIFSLRSSSCARKTDETFGGDDEEEDEEFDFAKNLALFDKQTVFAEIDQVKICIRMYYPISIRN